MLSAFNFLLAALPLTLAAPSKFVRRESNTFTGTQTNFSLSDVTRPFNPAGGVGVSPKDPPPIYEPLSNFDFQSLNLGLNQEWIELDLFHHGLAKFSDEEFDEYGIGPEERYLIQVMAEQEIGHATALTNILGPNAARPCNYTYPFETVPEFIDFCQQLTRWGEAGVYGFLPHLNSRPSAQILLQSITIEARQQMAFTQFEGLFPMPYWHNMGLSQSMQWTLLAPYLVSCPAENPKIEWQNFPALTVLNAPNATAEDFTAGISTNRTALTTPGQSVRFTWEAPGKNVSYGDGLYVTAAGANVTGEPRFAAWVSQLNVTYTQLTNVSAQNRTASTTQPTALLYPEEILAIDATPPQLVNGTVFVLLVTDDLPVTPYNMSLLNDLVVAGPAVYQSG